MAVVRPSEMNFADKKFSMIIFGAPGVGKTTLACSAPKSYLVDLDKGISRVKAQHRVVSSIIDAYEELEEDFKSPEFKAAETIVVDTGGALITYLQDYVMRKDPVNRQKNGAISLKGFGAVKAEFVALTNRLKTIYNKNVIYVFHSEESKDKDGNPVQRLLCEGSARNIVWQPCDFGCFVYMQGGERVAGFTPTDEYFAKGCYGIEGIKKIPALGTTDKNDYIAKLFEEARKNLTAEGKFFEEEKKLYGGAIAAGRALVDKVKDIKTIDGFEAGLKSIAHALTSEIEIRAMFKEKIKQLGIKWDKDKKAWTQEKPAESAQEELPDPLLEGTEDNE